MDNIFQIDQQIEAASYQDKPIINERCLEVEKHDNGVTFAVYEKEPGQGWDGKEILISYDEMRQLHAFLAGYVTSTKYQTR